MLNMWSLTFTFIADRKTTLFEPLTPKADRFHRDKNEIRSFFGVSLIFLRDKIEFRACSSLPLSKGSLTFLASMSAQERELLNALPKTGSISIQRMGLLDFR